MAGYTREGVLILYRVTVRREAIIWPFVSQAV
jgi:hypothetical protein